MDRNELLQALRGASRAVTDEPGYIGRHRTHADATDALESLKTDPRLTEYTGRHRVR